MLAPALTTLVTYFGQRVPARLDIRDGAGVPVPPEREQRLEPLAVALQAYGYQRAGRIAPATPDAPTTAFAIAMVHPEDGSSAAAIDVVNGALHNAYVELVTEFADGMAASTANHATPAIFAPLPRLIRTILHDANVDEVVAAHRRVCREHGSPAVFPSADPVSIAQAQNEEVLAYQEAIGLLRRRGEDYGFTWRGARRSVWTLWRAQKAAAAR